VRLELNSGTTWLNISDEVKREIEIATS
jgi:hypothetical protein